MANEFEEIANSGGKITFKVVTDEEGQRKYQTGITSASRGPVVMYGLYALSFGLPVASIRMGGIGQSWNAPPFPGCFPVLIASDSLGQFGHNCPRCSGYWRSGPWVNICPYCACMAETHEFLSVAQHRYVRHYCKVLREALEADDGETTIDMDAVAQATGKEGQKPAFYVSEESQQCKFTCAACEEDSDILGRFGYCPLCGTRNDWADFENKAMPAIRARINASEPPEDCVKAAVSIFDSFVGQYAKQLTELIPMTAGRKNRLQKQRFHDVEDLRKILKDWFDIDPCKGMQENERLFTIRMFQRRHVYEHNGGEVDQKYLTDSGDTSVRLKQHIHETKEDAHRLCGCLLTMARNIHEGFHELFPPIPEPIKAYEDKKARIAKYEKEQQG